jgi:hypothetical protein
MEKQAFDLQGLASSALQSAGKEFGSLKQVRERPFEILFKYIVPGLMVLRGHWVIGILMSVAQSTLGVGPETIGAWIDKAVGKGPGSGDAQIEESSLETASKGIVDRITTALLSKSAAFRAEIMKRGTLDAQSLVVAWAHGPDAPLEKQAYVGWANQLKSFLIANPIRGRGLFSGLLLSLLKALTVGIGIQTGVGMLFDSKSTTAPWGGFTTETPQAPAPGMRLYTNPVNSVERSLMMALDNAIKDEAGKPFSRIFMDLKGYSPIGSSEMGRILSEVRAAHGGADIREINSYRTFAAPPLTEVAKRLLPQATYEKTSPVANTPQGGKTKVPSGGDTQRELESIFGGAR